MAQTAAIKLATVVPDGSIWDKAIKQMGADWSFNAFNIPFFVQSCHKLNAVTEKLTPLLKQRTEA